MHGRSGSFFVNIINDISSDRVLPVINGNVPNGIHSSNYWEEIYIDLSVYEGQTIKVEFVTIKPDGNFNIPGDIAIDNIKVCAGATPIPTLSEWSFILLFISLAVIGLLGQSFISHDKNKIANQRASL
jgi:hypothetical protein